MWKDLDTNERAKWMAFFAGLNIFNRNKMEQMYNSFAQGGHIHQIALPIVTRPTRDEYFALRAAEELVKYYLEGSRNRNEPHRVLLPVSNLQKNISEQNVQLEKQHQNDIIKQFSEHADIPIYEALKLLLEQRYPVKWNGEYEAWYNLYNQSKNREAKEIDKYLSGKPIDASNCIATALSNNPNPGHYTTGILTFLKTFPLLGFRKVPFSEARDGSIHLTGEIEGFPGHGVIQDHKDESGDVYVNYSNGDDLYKKNVKLWTNPLYSFNFVGNHQDSVRWNNEYNQLYGNEYSKGGGIHIKPSHRGRLTELKKRTGKSEAELYRTGSAATRKMITFARNVRKWKHKHQFGGYDDIQDVDNDTQNWLRYWYSNRIPQLVSNFDNYYIVPEDVDRSQKYEDAQYLMNDVLDNVGLIPVNYAPLKNDLNGVYSQDYINDLGNILIRYGADNDALLHEKTHAINHQLGNMFVEDGLEFLSTPFQTAIGDITNGDLYDNGLWRYVHDDYLDNQDEIYSRLMQIRYRNNLDPKHKYTLDEIKKMRKENKLTLPKSDGLERYSDEFIQHLLNDVAYDDTKQSSNKAQRGGSIPMSKFGLWEYPNQVVDVPSNKITMKGVNYPVLGVSDTGDKKLMLPDGEYLFDGSVVREHPLQEGGYGTASPWNRALYNSINPTAPYPENIFDAASDYIYAKQKLKRGEQDVPEYKVGQTVGEQTADAAWRKRLGLPYDEFLLPIWNSDTVRLNKELEKEIPVDTNLLIERINKNRELQKQFPLKYGKNNYVNAAIKEDEDALNSLRKTYKTGLPVGMTEMSWNSRKLINNGEVNDRQTSPLNVMHKYNVRFDPKTKRMYYSDEYDFNQYEHFVPGEPFRIRGYVDLNKKQFGGFSWFSPYKYQIALSNVSDDLKQELLNSSGFFSRYVNSSAFSDKMRNAGLEAAPYGFTDKLKIVDKNLFGAGHSKNEIVLPVNQVYPGHSATIGSILVHEMAHSNPLFNMDLHGYRRRHARNSGQSPLYGRDYSKIPEEWKLMLRPNKSASKHDREFSEQYSNLQAIRYLLYNNGIFDATDRNAVFGNKEYDALLKIKESNSLIKDFLEQHDKQQVIDAINNVAYNNGSANHIQYGGLVKPFSYTDIPVVRYYEGGYTYI